MLLRLSYGELRDTNAQGMLETWIKGKGWFSNQKDVTASKA